MTPKFQQYSFSDNAVHRSISEGVLLPQTVKVLLLRSMKAFKVQNNKVVVDNTKRKSVV